MSLGKLSVTTAAVAAALALSACGGGGGGSSSGPVAPPSGSSISGKAIDGYLKNAKVCVDRNADGACDDGEPSATTGAGGNYTLSGATKDDIGKNLLVLIGTDTIDEARPADFKFAAPVTLVRQLDTLQGQIHISPLTTMVAAEVAKGLALPEAEAKIEKTVLNGSSPYMDFADPEKPNKDAGNKAQALVDAMVSVSKASGPSFDLTSVLAAASLFTQAKGVASDINKDTVEAEKDKIGSQLPADALALLKAGVYEYGDSHRGDSYGYDDVYPTKWLEDDGSAKGYRMSFKLSEDGKKFTWRDEVFDSSKWVVDTRDQHGYKGSWKILQDGSWGPFREAGYESNQTYDVTEIGKDSITIKSEDGVLTQLAGLRVKPQQGTALKDALLYGRYTPIAAELKQYINGSLDQNALKVFTRAVMLNTDLDVSAWTCGEGSTPVKQQGIEHCNYFGKPDVAYTSVRDAMHLQDTQPGAYPVWMYGGQFKFEGDRVNGQEGPVTFIYWVDVGDDAIKPVQDKYSVRWKLRTIRGHELITFDINESTFPGNYDDAGSDEVKVIMLNDGILQTGFLSEEGLFEEITAINHSYFEQLMKGYDQMLDYLRNKLRV
ncbi:hypothetical protein [Craterilacuibacter sp. RT1T]|uniref:hypothetical protein n=1 Tax=Craterilacuibacter sp. RT1T TaxID=2942211 RepID=UPI0020BFC5F6|nr:hypothetical protein [Craterilacuibacter sp. RT1T]MCL6263601.1 hypothetical protein [Craterilacuibacter sp. RT1T]